MATALLQRCHSSRVALRSSFRNVAPSRHDSSASSSLSALRSLSTTVSQDNTLLIPTRHRGHRRKQQQQQQQTSSSNMRPFPMFLSVAAALTLRSHSTLGDTTRLDAADKDKKQHPPGRHFSYKYTRRPDCPAYGCPLTPHDVHYNTEPIKSALQELRLAKRVESTATASETLLQSAGHQEAVTLTLIGYKGGPLHEQINQDRAIIVMPFQYPSATKAEQDSILLGVFDGHAPRGELVSEFAAKELPERLSMKLAQAVQNQTQTNSKAAASSSSELLPVATVKQLLSDTFVEIDRDAPAHGSGGCTATVILSFQDKIFVANAGDSRSFIVTYRPSTKQSRVVYISREDKPDLPDEKARVEAAGGQVYIPARGTSRVVYHDPRTGAPSGLAMSRSIGDWAAGKLGVIPDPIVDVIDIPRLVREERGRTVKGGEDATTSTFLFLDDQGDVVAGDSYSRSSSYASDESGADEDDVYIFGVSATDGMLDYLDENDIARVLAKALFEQDGAHPLTAAEHLVFAAANGWQQDKQGRYRDDIAIAVATLRRPLDAKSQGAFGDTTEL